MLYKHWYNNTIVSTRTSYEKLLISTLIALSSLLAHATDWVQIGSGNNFTHHIDRDSIQTHRFTGGGTYVAALSKRDYYQA